MDHRTQMEKEDSKLITPAEAMRLLGISSSTLQRLDDVLRPQRINPRNGHRRYRLDVLQAHLKRSI